MALRKQLRVKGVFVQPNGKIVTLADTLIITLMEEERHEWTDEEITQACKEVAPMKTRELRDRISPNYLHKTFRLEPAEQVYHQPYEQPYGYTQPATVYNQAQTPVETRAQTPVKAKPQHEQLPALPLLPGNQHHAKNPQNPPTRYGTPDTQNYAKEIAMVVKMYTDDQKYSGVDESFDYKLRIFYDICERSGLPPAGYAKAFPTMLKGLAQDNYYNYELSGRSFSDICTHFRDFFEGPGYHRKNLDVWNATTLPTIIQENAGKSTEECLQLLISKLRSLKHGLSPGLQNLDFLHNKVVTACQGVPACRYAVSDPPADFSELMNKLRSSIIAYKKEQSTTNAFFTDRRYYRNDNRNNPTRNGYKGTTYGQNQHPYPRRKFKCFVCCKEGCHSRNHTPEEREKEKARWERERSQKTFRQYLAEYEGDEDDENNDSEASAEDLDVDIDPSNEPTTTDTHFTHTYHTSFGELCPEEAKLTASTLANKAFIHSVRFHPAAQGNQVPSGEDNSDPFTYNVSTSRYTSTTFVGIMIDTGASSQSTAGYGQFCALQKLDASTKLDVSTKGKVNVQFGIGSTSSIGSTWVTTPIGKTEFHIVEVDTPFLLCLADMDRLQVYFNNLDNILVSGDGKVSVPVARRFGHPFLLWKSLQSFIAESFDKNPCYLTTTELQRLHRRFGHPSAERLQKVLERSGHDIEKKTIDHLTKYCHYCQKHGRSPGRFRFTLRDDADFNYAIIVDIMYISSNPILHVVDEATRFQAGRWLQNISARHTWDILRTCWIDTYLGPPDLIVHDAGKNFMSKEFKQYAITMGVNTKGVPVEAHNSIGMVERYHGPIRRAYQIIATELPDLDKNMALQMAFKAINDSVGPDGLVPTLLVFGAYPRMAESDAPSPSVTQRAAAIKKAMSEIQKLRAERQVADALNMRNGPQTTTIHDLPPNSPVLVWREGNTNQNRSWEGLYPLFTIKGKTYTI